MIYQSAGLGCHFIMQWCEENFSANIDDVKEQILLSTNII